MVSSENGQVADADDAAQQAAEVAIELTETGQIQDRRRLTTALNGVARSASRVVGQGSGIAKRGGVAARRRAGSAGRGAASSLGWLSAQVVAMGPRLSVRDRETLRARFPGRSDEEIANLLIERAASASAAVGAATGAWAALPVLPAFPAEIAAETLAVVGIEIKLVAELHEIYGVPATGSPADRARAYIGAWAHRRGVVMVPGGLLLVAGSPLARQLRRRLAARVRRSAFSLGPLFTGALAGALLNRTESRRLGRDIIADLRRRPTINAEVVSDEPPTDPRD
jgi:hypothetical protein